MRRRNDRSLTRRAVLGTTATAMVAGCSSPSSTTAAWPMFGYDAARTGVHPTATGPTGPVEVAWRRSTGGDFLASPVLADDTVYIGGRDGAVHAVDATTGSRQWTFNGAGSAFNAPLAVQDGIVYAGNADHRLYALAADGGISIFEFNFGLTEWWTEFPASVVSAPAIVENRCYVQTTEGIGYAIDRTSGKARWRAGVEGKIFTSPTIADGVLYLQGAGDRTMVLTAIDTHTGERQWRIDHGTDRPPTRSTPAVRDGQLVFGSNDGQLYALSTEGTPQWTYTPAGIVASSPAIGPDRIYGADTAGTVFAVDPADGRQLWQTTVDIDPPVVPTAPAVADGTVYVGVGPRLHAFDRTSGDRRWRVATAGPITGSPVVLDGRVYVQSSDGTLYCLRTRG